MLDKLKEYKELIAIIVFFLGGFFWLQTQYPDKKDLASVTCLLDKYMKLTQLQLLSQELDKQVSIMETKISDASSHNGGESNVPMSPAMLMELEQLKQDYTTKRNELGQTGHEMTQIRDDLMRAVCRMDYL